MLPAIDAFPVFTPIPFTLNIVTVSKPMRREDIPQGEPIFPAPPLTPKGVTFKLERSVFVQVHAWRSDGNQSTVGHLGGLSPEPAPPHFYDAVRTEGLEKVWVPELGDEKKQKGTWKQEVNFLSNFQLACPPTFKSQTMGVDVWFQTHPKGDCTDPFSLTVLVVFESRIPGYWQRSEGRGANRCGLEHAAPRVGCLGWSTSGD